MAYDLNGTTSQYLSTSASVPFSGPPFTMACWFQSDSATNGQALLRLNTASSSHYTLFAAGDLAGDPLRFATFSGLLASCDTTTGYTTNTWHHACAVATSNSNRTVFIDGGSSASSTTSQSITPTSIRIGAFNLSQFPLDGRVAEVGIWNTDLTASEVLSLARGMTCAKVRPQSLVFYAPLVRNLQDVKGGLTITNNNSATVANHPRVYA